MSWLEFHRQSEIAAQDAATATAAGDINLAQFHYAHAADLELKALNELGSDKPRTLGITAASTVALLFKSGDLEKAETLAFNLAAREDIPAFARNDLRQLLQAVWSERNRQESGLAFAHGKVLVSVAGGQTVTGGAPLELIVSKAQVVQRLLYRTAEFLNHVPLRRRGQPASGIQARYRPWIFQAPAGSYQFAVAIESSPQSELFQAPEVDPSRIPTRFLEIVRASVESPRERLAELVPDENYRKTFIRMVRQLTPDGKAAERVELTSSEIGVPSVLLVGPMRDILSVAIAPTVDDRAVEEERLLRGTLRALHLDDDWLEVVVDGSSERVYGLTELVDDIIGPMVNHEVVVRTSIGRRRRLQFRDIDLVDPPTE